MILGQGHGHDTPMGHGQQLCEILSSSNLAVRSYGPDTDFQYVCTVTLTLEIWPWVKVMTHPWVMDNNCVKLYPDRTREYEVMAQTRCEQTNRQTDQQTDRVIPTVYTPPQNFVCGGIKRELKYSMKGANIHFNLTITCICVKYYPDPTWQWGVMARTWILGMCALWPWPWSYDLGSMSWHILRSLR